MFTVDERHPNVISVREGGATTYFWVADGMWSYGQSFDSGVNGPFASYEVAVEDWRKRVSQARGHKQKEV